jgi:V/A-type H+/Na+-transporting ATPase subunit B
MTGKEYRTITDVKGPLVFLNKTEPVAFGEIVTLRLSNGTIKNGQVLDTSDDLVIVQVFEGTAKIDRESGVTFMGDVFKLPVSTDLVGRILDGAGRPRDGGPEIVAEEKADIIGAAINPYSRQSPNDFIQTGVSAIDLCTSLVRGQKLPIFSASGLPHNDIALQIARQAKLKDSMKNLLLCSVQWELPLKNTISSVPIWSEPVLLRMRFCSLTLLTTLLSSVSLRLVSH